jgi:Mg-chelatase subunit ChlD
LPTVSRGRGRAYPALLALLLLLLTIPAIPAQAEPATDGGADLVIVLDRSGSMATNDPQDLAVTGARVLLDMLDPGDRVAVVAFDTTARTIVPLQRLGDGAAVKRTLAGLGRPVGEWTDIKGALTKATDLLSETAGPEPAGQEPAGQAVADRPRAVLLFTDGKPETTPDGVPPGYRDEMAAQVSRMAGRAIPVFAVGLGQADFATLAAIATASRAESFAATSPTQAVKAFADVLARLKDRHVALSFEEDLAPGQAGRERTLTVPPYTRLLTLSAVSSGTVRLRGQTPAGTPLDAAPGLKESAGGNYVVYTIPNPAPGVWTVQLEGAGRLEAHGATESTLKLRLVAPVPYSQVAAGHPADVAVLVAGDPDPGAGLELWAQGGGGTAVRLMPQGGRYTGKVSPGDGRLAVWAVRAGGEVARQEFRLYPTPMPGGPPAAAPAPKGSRWWLYLTFPVVLVAGTLAYGAWNWRRIRRREETVSGRLGSLVLRGGGRELLIGAGPAQLGAGAPQPAATLSARLTPLIWAPLAGLGLGRLVLHIYIRPAPGVRLEINGRPAGDGRLYHGDEVRLGGETYPFANSLLPRRPAVAARRTGAGATRPLNR